MNDSRPCEFCGSTKTRGQPFSGDREYYCSDCDEVYAWTAERNAPVGDCGNPIGHLVAELASKNATGAVVAHEGSLDATVTALEGAGWVLDDTVYLHGKRIRYMIRPGGSSE